MKAVKKKVVSKVNPSARPLPLHSGRLPNASVIEQLVNKLKSKKSSEVRGGLLGIRKSFSLLLKDGCLRPPAKIIDDSTAVEKNHPQLLSNLYSETHGHLLNLVNSSVSQIQNLAVRVILKVLQKEAQYPLTNKFHSFPYEKYKNLLSFLVDDRCNRKLISNLQQFMDCDDFTFYTVKGLCAIVTESGSKNKTNGNYQSNVLDLLGMINISSGEQKSSLSSKQFKNAFKENATSSFKMPRKELLKNYNTIWMSLLSWELTELSCKRCLILLPEKVLHHLDNPVSLTDFFLTSYQRGGASALMSLHGVFVLITQYNVEYPDFYPKVYAMLESSLFQTRYKPRFFILLNKFLSSTHLPQYILTAFVKKLSRLLLTAPTSCLILLIRFIVTLIVRHPCLRVMVDNPNGIDHDSDPFIEDEADLSKCRASESSLWELSTMLHHPIPAVVKAASFLNRNLPEVELDITGNVEDTFEDIYEQCSKIRSSQVSTTFIKPESLFKYPDDEMSTFWSVV